MPRRVLVVDDEADLAELVAYNLWKAGFETRVAHNGDAGLRALGEFNPDLVILDVMMPELSGYEVLARIRRSTDTASLPVILLTARSEENDELQGLAAGADDYITKPFSMKVLEARIDALLRRSFESRDEQGLLTVGPVSLNKQTHEASLAGQLLSLTVTEFRLLSALIEAQGKVLSRHALIQKAMGSGVTITERTIDVHVTAIRKKFGEASGLIKTVRGVGYRIDADTSPSADAGSDAPSSAAAR